MAGPRAMPGLVPTSPDGPASAANWAAWQRLSAWDKPFLVAFSDSDPITGAMAPALKPAVPGAAGIDHPVITGASHFLQERRRTTRHRHRRLNPLAPRSRTSMTGAGSSQIAGRVVTITGAGRGIGAATGRLLAAQGARLVLGSRG